MVMLIISILAVSVIMRSPGQIINVAAQADQIIGDIRYTQSLAMTHGQRFRINFSANSYSISSLDGVTLYPQPASGASTTTLNNGITLASTYAFLAFDTNGAPYTDAVLPGTALAADEVITLSSAGDSSSIRVSAQTGRVIRQ